MVVDASVAAKWLFLESGSEEAFRILESCEHFVVPDLFFVELDAVIIKKLRRRELTADEAMEKKLQAGQLPFEIMPYSMIRDTAFEISTAIPVTLYDATYIATALLRKIPFVTADERLVNGCATTPLSKTVQSIYG